MTAKEMFELLGYHPIDHYLKWDSFVCGYEINKLAIHYPQFVLFADSGVDNRYVTFDNATYVPADLVKPVYEQTKELGWLE